MLPPTRSLVTFMKLKPAALLSILVTSLLLAGCAPKLSPQTQLKIRQLQQKSAVAVAEAHAKADESQAQGHDTPVMHPIAATNNLVVEIRPILIWITVVSFVLWAVQFGLSFTSFSFLAGLAPVFRWVSVLSLAGLITLPFLPLGFLIMGIALVSLVIYELVKDKGKVPEALEDTETVLIHLTHPTAATPEPASPPAVSTTPASAPEPHP